MKPPGLLDVLIKKKKNTWRRAAEVSLAAAVMEHGKEPQSAAGTGDQGPENSSTSQWVPYRPATTAAASSAASFSTL